MQTARNYGVLRTQRRVLSMAGDGVGQTKSPFGLCESASGGVLVCDYGNHRLQELFMNEQSPRVVLTYPPNKGAVAIVRLGENFGVLDAAHQLRVVRGNGTVLSTAGAKGNSPMQFNCPFDVRVLPNGNILVSDQVNNRLQVLDPTGTKFIKTMAVAPEVKLNHPRGLAVSPDGRIYVVDHVNDRVVVLSPEGALLRQLTTGPDGTPLSRPFGVALDAFGNALVADWNNSRIVVFGPDGETSAFNTPGRPRAVLVDSSSNVLVSLEEGQVLLY